MSFKIGFLFLVPADLALICWLKYPYFLKDVSPGIVFFFDWMCQAQIIHDANCPFPKINDLPLST